MYDLGESEGRLARAYSWNPTDSKTIVADCSQFTIAIDAFDGMTSVPYAQVAVVTAAIDRSYHPRV